MESFFRWNIFQVGFGVSEIGCFHIRNALCMFQHTLPFSDTGVIQQTLTGALLMPDTAFGFDMRHIWYIKVHYVILIYVFCLLFGEKMMIQHNSSIAVSCSVFMAVLIAVGDTWEVRLPQNGYQYIEQD